MHVVYHSQILFFNILTHELAHGGRSYATAHLVHNQTNILGMHSDIDSFEPSQMKSLSPVLSLVGYSPWGHALVE